MFKYIAIILITVSLFCSCEHNKKRLLLQFLSYSTRMLEMISMMF